MCSACFPDFPYFPGLTLHAFQTLTVSDTCLFLVLCIAYVLESVSVDTSSTFSVSAFLLLSFPSFPFETTTSRRISLLRQLRNTSSRRAKGSCEGATDPSARHAGRRESWKEQFLMPCSILAGVCLGFIIKSAYALNFSSSFCSSQLQDDSLVLLLFLHLFIFTRQF